MVDYGETCYVERGAQDRVAMMAYGSHIEVQEGGVGVRWELLTKSIGV